MSELDHLREEVAYLKFWLGIVVVTAISLAGWLISSSDAAAPYTVFFAVAGLVLLSAGIVFLHRRIERRIAKIKELKLVELIAAIAMFGVVLVIVAVAFDAARRAK